MRIGPLLLFLALLVVPPLLSALGRWLRQQIAEAGGGGELGEPPPEPGRERKGGKTRRSRVVPAALAPAAVTAPPAGPSVPVAAPRRVMLEGLDGPRGLRHSRAACHSIVVAAVLGPCRALDPY